MANGLLSNLLNHHTWYRRIGHNLPVAILLILILKMGNDLAITVPLNMASVMAVKQLTTNAKITIPVNLKTKSLCADYPSAVLSVQESLPTVETFLERKRLLDKVLACLPVIRRYLLVPMQSQLLWEAGRHQAACDLLRPWRAYYAVLSLAEQSYQKGDVGGAEIYLSCLQSDKVWWGVRPSDRLAYLYFDLGRYYENSGQIGQALAAYQQTVVAYPAVWSEPYVAIARLHWDAGERDQALETLRTALIISFVAKDTYLLWRELGLRWESEGNLQAAWCAYSEAQAIESQVALNYAPEDWRDDLAKRRVYIYNLLPSEQHDCTTAQQWVFHDTNK